MKTRYNFLAITLPILILTGCVFSTEPYRGVRHHDLGIPPVRNPDGPTVQINKFKINGPYIFKMVFRADNNELKINDYDKWAQVPEQMLGRYLKMTFSGKDKTEPPESFTVSGTILAFEGNRITRNAIMTIEYTIKKNQGKNRVKTFCETFTESMPEVNSSNLAAAMSKNAERLTDRIYEEIKMKNK